ncbi:hypothetical protein FHS72_002598 [Loktanella ponticola]|uniref:Peptidase inhibitor I78 n=1 Tax=Yoonia ponticola TaxID=1524255 RepID=A0A7W9EYN9_9RHOB|nr:I78 family peptidase inhibitor [Yoonia ponticola]MBB5722962.1 hypothetical protein [Yoonia ponticola]
MRLIILAMLGTLTTACIPATAISEPPVADPIPTGINDSCGAARYAGIIGQDAFVLERGFRPGEIRIIRPGTVASQEYLPERMSFEIGASGNIRRIVCG